MRVQNLVLYIFAIMVLLLKPAFADEVECVYPEIIEKILFYKDDKFKVFYGGPIDRASKGLRWVSSICFEDGDYKTRAVYELCFVNCDFHDAEGAEILFIKVSDANIKFKNTLSQDYRQLSDLLDGKYSSKKYIVVRQSDIAIIFYPDIFIETACCEAVERKDKEIISQFLRNRFNAKEGYIDYYSGGTEYILDYENEVEASFKPIDINIQLNGTERSFKLTKKILKEDQWKVYYIISRDAVADSVMSSDDPTLIRIDSGCVSGQIYDDEACDCLDQLHEGLLQISDDKENNCLIIHIPTQDGRGFGTAPKAETEIYKRGGRGRVHATQALDTIAAAKLLYGTLNYDLRTYDGAAKILKSMGINQVSLLTDNVVKVNTLEKHGIEVIRKKTGTEKRSCINHIKSKKASVNYYDN